MKTSTAVLICLAMIILFPVACVMNWGCRIASDAVNTAYSEVSPQELLRKYSWFKDASAQLDKKLADIKVYSARQKSLINAYTDKSRSQWSREDREQSNLWESEVAGVKASYNSLAAEYNASMAKINWAFCEIGKLPPGASITLPRSYKPYEEN